MVFGSDGAGRADRTQSLHGAAVQGLLQAGEPGRQSDLPEQGQRAAEQVRGQGHPLDKVNDVNTFKL